MVLPDGAGSKESRPRTGRAILFVLAGVLVVAGFVALGSLTPSDPIAVEATTTTTEDPTTTIEEVTPPIDPDDFSVSQIARGEPLVWESAMILDDSYPIALLDHDGWIYLFSTEQPNFSSFDVGGLRGWRTTDGQSWEPLGQVIPEAHVITTVASSGQGLVALEVEPTESGFTIWRSEDGENWLDEDIPVDIDNPYLGAIPMAVGGTEDLLVVTGGIDVHLSRLIEEKLGSAVGENLDVALYGWSTDLVGDDIVFNLHGPLGFPLASVGSEELGLTAEEQEILASSYSGGNTQTIVWVKAGEGEWQQILVPMSLFTESVATTADGEILLLGWGPNGFSRWSSEDGMTWEPSGVIGPSRVDEWGDTLVGPTSTGGASILVDQDGTWDDIGPREHFSGPVDWTLGATAAGAAGVATMVDGWMNSARMAPQPDPVTLSSEDTTLTLDFAANSYELEAGDYTRTWSMTEATPEGISVDLERGVIIFEDPDTSELLASYPLADIDEAQKSFWSDWSWTSQHQAFAFTADGENWTIQDRATIGEDIDIGLLEVTDSSVIAAGINNADMFNPTLSPGFGVWSAPIP